jgi:hypothetical protein
MTTGRDTSRRLPCPEYDADPSSTAIQERCKAWSGLGIAAVTRHLRYHHAGCHGLIDRLNSSKLQTEARYQKYRSFFSSAKSCDKFEVKHSIGGPVDAKAPDFKMESQRSAQGYAHFPRNPQDSDRFDGLTEFRHQPGLQSYQGGRIPPQQILCDTVENHPRSGSAGRSTNAAPLNTDGPYKQAPETNDHFSVPLNDQSFTTGLNTRAHASYSLGSNASMVIPSTALNHQRRAWSSHPEGIPFSTGGLPFDTDHPSERFAGALVHTTLRSLGRVFLPITTRQLIL